MYSSSQLESAVPLSQSAQSAETSSISSGDKGRGTEGLVPVTVKQLSEAYQSGDEKSNFQVDGADVTNVTLVGMVAQKVARVIDVSFTIDDGTGKVECRRWINEGSDSKEMDEIQSKHGVAPTQPNPVEYSATPISSQSTSCGHVAGPSNEFSGQYSDGGLKRCDQKVLEYLQGNFSIEKGVHRDEISSQLRIPAEKIMESIRTTEEEGLIYSTIDEDHYKSTTES